MVPELVPHRLASVFSCRHRLSNDAVLNEFIGTDLCGEEFQQFVSAYHKLLPDGIPYELVLASLRHLAGQMLTEPALIDTAWRISGNLDRLRNLQPVLPWCTQVREEWVPTQILRGTHYRTQRTGKIGMVFQFQVLAGSPCPLVLSQFWSRSFCRLVSRRLGFSSSWGKYPLRDATELINMRLYVLVDPAKSRDGKPGFSQVHEKQPQPLLQWNRQLHKWRARVTPDFACVRNYPARNRCFQCHVGLDQCPAATHETTFFRRLCRICGQQSWFDHDSQDACVNCRIRDVLRPRGN